MGQGSSAPSEVSLARGELGESQLAALDALFAEHPALDQSTFLQRVCPAPLGSRFFAVLAVNGVVPADVLVIAKARLEARGDAALCAFAAEALLGCGPAVLASELVAAAYPGTATEAEASSLLPSADALLKQPAALLSLRTALCIPRPPAPALDWQLEAAPRAALMRPAWAWALAPLLPPALTKTWRLLFSTEVHGASYSTLVSRSSHMGAVLVLVRDTAGALAAGFADASVEPRAAFAAGGSRAFLAGLLPAFSVHHASAANSNRIWLAHGFASVPNGIGFGGQVGHFGLFVDAGMECGHSRFSATYTNPPLLGAANDASGAFLLDALEVWGVDAEAIAEAEAKAATAARRAAGGGSVLDRCAQDRAFLQASTGRGSASDGLR